MTWVATVPAIGWAQALPGVLLAVVLLWLPGGLVARAAGARGRDLLAAAPVVTAGLLGLLAGLSSLALHPAGAAIWDAGLVLWLLLAAVVAAGAAALLARWTTPRRTAATARREPRTDADGTGRPGAEAAARWWDLTPLVLSCLLSAALFVRATGAAGAIEQSNDSPFHLLAIQRVAQTGDGSWQTIRAVTNDTGFYPPLADDTAAFLLQVLHLARVPVDVVTAGSTLLLVCVALVWPLGVDALVRAVLPGRSVADRVGRAAAVLLVPATAAFPAQLLDYGALWPNLVGLSLVPAVLAALARLLDAPRVTGGLHVGPAPALVVAGLGLVGVALAHPNALLSMGVAALGLVGAAAWRLARRRPVLGGMVLGLGLLVALAGLLVLVRLAPAVTSYSANQPWSVPGALGRVLALSPVSRTLPALAGILALVGVVDAVRRRRGRWLVAGWILTAVQVVLAGAVDARVTAVLTGLWYHEPARLSSALTLTALPLAGLGAAAAVRGLRALGPRSRSATALAAVAALAWAGAGVRDVLAVERDTYQGLGADRVLVTPAEMALFARTLGTSGDADGTGGVIGDPFGGAMFAGLASGRHVGVAHFGTNIRAGSGVGGLSDTARAVYHFQRLTTDPQVCAALRRLRIGYAVEDARPIWQDDPRASSYAYLRGLEDHPGLTLLGRAGTTSVYRITGCA